MNGPDDLSRLLDDEAVAAAVRTRRAARAGRDRARDAATWVGTLRDLAERRAWLRVLTRTGDGATGELIAVADDHLVLRQTGGAVTVIARDATTGIRERGDAGGRSWDPAGSARSTAYAAAGARPAPTDRTLLEVLDRWREDGAPVHLVTDGGDSERGDLATVGDDVVSVRTSAGMLHVPVEAIVMVTVR